MSGAKRVEIRFELTGGGTADRVDVRLRSAGERWIANVEATGRREVAVGPTARQALNAALAPFGSATSAALASDPALIGASTQLLRAQTV